MFQQAALHAANLFDKAAWLPCILRMKSLKSAQPYFTLACSSVTSALHYSSPVQGLKSLLDFQVSGAVDSLTQACGQTHAVWLNCCTMKV